MSSTLDSLKMLANSSTITYPFDSEQPQEAPAKKKKKSKEPKFLQDSPEKPQKKARSEYSSKDIIEELNEKLEKYGELGSDDFDGILDSVEYEDEDLELKNALIGMGRKYARANTVSEGANEIDKAYAANEQFLRNMLVMLDKDMNKIEKDLENLRGSGYNRNPIKTAELVSAKNSLYSNQLNAIGKLNDITKTKFDLKAKADKNSSDSNESFVTNNIMQQLFGMGHKAILEDMGGRDNDVYYDDEDRGSDRQEEPESAEDIAGEQACEDYENSRAYNEGDIYLKYEGQKIDQILEYNSETQQYSIYAENEAGERLTDYPVPKDPNDLIYDINSRNHTAVDQLQRHYKYREI